MNLKEHKELLNDWRARYADATFVSDGPIDPTRWLAVERRVLFLAKEAYGDEGPGQNWDLSVLVREEWRGPRYKFWWTLGYWAYGMQRLTPGPIPLNPKYDQQWERVTDAVLSSAVVNIKKARGRSSSDDDDLRQYVHNDRGLLRRQVESLNPHVVVCCYTWHLVKEMWPQAVQISERVFSTDGLLMLDFWHPANQYPDVLSYYASLVLLQRALYPTMSGS